MSIPDSFKAFDLNYLVNLDDEHCLYDELSVQFNELGQNFYYKANLELLSNLHLSDHAHVLEIACGTGKLAIQLANRLSRGKVVGVDISEQMIEQGRKEALEQGVNNLEFIVSDVHHALPELKARHFQVGISCFAMVYLGCDFLLKELYEILGPEGQVGITTSSLNTFTEWHPAFFELLMTFPEIIQDFGVSSLPDMPQGADDLKQRMEKAGFKNVEVISQTLPLSFKNAADGIRYLISAGFISNYFFKITDKEKRRTMLEWMIDKIEKTREPGKPATTSIEFLIGYTKNPKA